MYTELFETVYPINTPRKGKGVAVSAVDPFALGDRAGIKPGDRILRVNGREVRDFLDFQFYTGSEDRVSLDVVTGSGLARRLDVEVGEGEIWGLDLEHFAPRQCANDCIFCFCNQNPEGSRESLFFKDEDTRLSFLHGNYTTMSSISKMEMDRIIEQRLSPQYVSVHATDAEVRRYLLGRKRPDDILAKMRYLADHGIELHAQIVLCPTINDGDVLRRTAEDLAELHPPKGRRRDGPDRSASWQGGLTSVAVVPVVFTRLHNYRHLLTPVTDQYARESIKQVRPWQREFRRRFGQTFLFLADEFYLRAGVPLPGAPHYGDYPQIEDGVGMVRRFVREARRTLAGQLDLQPGSLDGTIATGELFHPTLARFVDELNTRFKTRLQTVPIRNRFFGEEVTVAGLLAGGDIIAARESVCGDFLIVPEQACLKSGHIFLDDMTLSDIEDRLDLPVSHGGNSLFAMLERAVRLQSQRQAAAQPGMKAPRRSASAV
jgi:putative radical SAM enzyme (TIGR03279 family)